MKKLLSLLIIATIITSSLCVSYFAIDDNSTQNNAESTTVPVTETSSTVVTTEPVTESSTVESSTVPTTTKPIVKPVVKVKSIKLNKSIVNLAKKGNTCTLKATVYPTNAKNKKVSWKASNKNITVNQNGKVTAKKLGTSKIKVTAKDGSKKSATVLVVVGEKVKKITLNKTSVTLNNNRTYKLKKSISNKNAVYKAVQWKSTNTKIATVNSNGVVKGLKRGSCYVVATTMDGSKKSVKCKVRVIKLVKKITFDKKNKYNVDYGKSITLKAMVEPSDASIKALKWKSSNNKVLTVDKNGKVIAKGLGSAVITASATDGSGIKINRRVSINIPSNKKLTVKQIKSEYTMKKFCSMFNNYFKSCGAKIEPRLKGTHQWYVSDTQANSIDGYYSLNDMYIETLEYWIQEMSGDFLNNKLDWNNKGYLEDDDKYADFLESFFYSNKIGYIKYNKNLVLNSKYNGFDWLVNVFSKKDPISIYIDFEKLKDDEGKNVKDNKGNQEYLIKFYYDWQSSIDEVGWDKLKD